MKCTPRGDGEQALARAAAAAAASAILDIGMPHLSGYEVASRIRGEAWGGRMVLIALTGWGQAQDQAKARESGFDHHCTKPVDIVQLLALVEGAPGTGAAGAS